MTKEEFAHKVTEYCLALLGSENIDNFFLPSVSSQETFIDWFFEWYDTYKRPSLTPSTLALYKSIIDKKILPFFNGIKLSALTSKDIQLFLNEIPYSNTRRKAYNLINACLRKADTLDKLVRNPMRAVEIVTKKQKKKRAFEFFEQELVLEKALPKYKAMFFFLCCTGLRLGEFISLTETDIDNYRNCITITKQFDHRVKKTVYRTKTESSIRRIPYIEDLLKTTYLLNESDNFFGSFTYEGVKDFFKRFTRENNLVGLSCHSTRHTFASVCYFCGVPDKRIQSWLGHSTISMTMNTYTDLLNKGTSSIREYIEKLKKSIEN